jgi:hypothetical protein
MIARTIFAITLLLAMATPVYANSTDSSRWSISLGPRMQHLVGSGYAELPPDDVRNGRPAISDNPFGAGIGVALGCRITDRFTGRLSVATYRHGGKVASAWAVGDLGWRSSIGGAEVLTFVRTGRQTVTHDALTDIDGKALKLTYTGWLGGGGIETQIYLSKNVSIGAEVALTYVHINNRIRSDGSGIYEPLSSAFSGTTWGAEILSVAYHW